MPELEDLVQQYANKHFVNQEPTESEEPFVASPEFSDALQKVIDSEAEASKGRTRELLGGLTFQTSDELEALITSNATGRPYKDVYYEIAEEREKFKAENPGTALAYEIGGSLPTSILAGSAASKAGLNFTRQGIVGGGIYGGASGDTVEERLQSGATLGAFGAVLGKGLDSLGKAKGVAPAVDDPAAPAAVVSRWRSGEDVSDDELWDAAYNWGHRETIEQNRFLFPEAKETEALITKEIKKDGVTTLEIPKALSPVTLRKVQQKFTEGLPQTPEGLAEAGRIGRKLADLSSKRGGFRYSDDLLELEEADVLLPGMKPSASPNSFKRWFDRTFLPVSEMLNSYFDPRLGRLFERAAETTARMNARFFDDFVKPTEAVAKAINGDAEIMRLFLDLNWKPKNLKKIRKSILSKTGPEGLSSFNKWWDQAASKGTEHRKRLFRGREYHKKKKEFEDNVWDTHYVHMYNRQEKNKGLDEPLGSPFKEKVDSLQTRSRKPAKDMTDEEVLAYENPVLSHSRYITDQENLLELQAKFGLPPTLSKRGDSADFFGGLRDRLIKDGMEEGKAQEAANLMHEAWKGSRRSPPAAIRAFMNLAYAGTLAQFKSAVLNLHDIPVAAVNNGEMPTMKALLDNTTSEFGETVRKMLGEQNVGEFRRNFDKYISSPDAWSKISRGTQVIADGSMFISGFRWMDELGKGVILRTAVNAAREAAQNGTLYTKYADMFRPHELAEVEPWLKKGTKVKDMPPQARAFMEELAFTKLGEQQLISYAGRPVGYMSNPLLRPAYAMTGFAIKQMALLRRNVLGEMKKGNYDEAAKYAARYVVYAGFGYGMINETRNAIFKGEEFEPEGILLGAVDQIAAAMTLNRLGDQYSREQFWNNPVEHMMTSFLPPGGLGEAFGQALVGDFVPIVHRIPGAGDPLRYYIRDKDED